MKLPTASNIEEAIKLLTSPNEAEFLIRFKDYFRRKSMTLDLVIEQAHAAIRKPETSSEERDKMIERAKLLSFYQGKLDILITLLDMKVDPNIVYRLNEMLTEAGNEIVRRDCSNSARSAGN